MASKELDIIEKVNRIEIELSKLKFIYRVGWWISGGFNFWYNPPHYTLGISIVIIVYGGLVDYILR